MNYVERIEKTLMYIEDNLKKEITLDILAVEASLSKYYFHRLFTALVGTSPMEYIRNRRLATAAKQMENSKQTVLEIALDYKFESQEVFTRAFNKYFGISPGKYRKINEKISLYDKVSVLGVTANIEIDTIIKPKIVFFESRKIAGYSLCTSIKENDEKHTISDFWKETAEKLMKMPNRINFYENIGICEGEDMQGALYHTACCEVNSFEGMSQDVITGVLPASKYIVFTHTGKSYQVMDTYRYIYKNWLPFSGYGLSKHGKDMQIYDFRKYIGSGEFTEFDICLPIE